MEETNKNKIEILDKKEDIQNISKNNDKDKTFNKLKKIQDLLKKESSLNNLRKLKIKLFLYCYSQ